MPRPHWGDRALLAAERRLLPPQARPMARAAERGQRGLWFRTAAIFMVSLSAGLLGLNAFLLFNAPKSEAATASRDRDAASLAALPSPRAPDQGYVASAAGVGRVIIAEARPVAALTTDAYAMVGHRVQAAYPQRDDVPSSMRRTSGRADGWVEPVSAPMPVNASMSGDPITVAESQARADEAIRVIAASTPSVDRAAVRDPASIDAASPASSAPVDTTVAPEGVRYGDGGLR